MTLTNAILGPQSQIENAVLGPQSQIENAILGPQSQIEFLIARIQQLERNKLIVSMPPNGERDEGIFMHF
jgi:hypothetical protein